MARLSGRWCDGRDLDGPRETSMNRRPTTERRMTEDYAAGRNDADRRSSSDRRGARSLMDSVADTARKILLGLRLSAWHFLVFCRPTSHRRHDPRHGPGDRRKFGSAGRTGADMAQALLTPSAPPRGKRAQPWGRQRVRPAISRVRWVKPCVRRPRTSRRRSGKSPVRQGRNWRHSEASSHGCWRPEPLRSARPWRLLSRSPTWRSASSATPPKA